MDTKLIKENISQLWFDDGHLSIDQRDFYIELISELNPKTCLEIGFAGGRHTVTMLYSCNPTKVLSLDINFNYHGGQNMVDKIKDKFTNIEFITGDSTKLLTSDFFRTHFPNGVDYILVDGGHSYDVAINDIKNCYPHLSKKGILIVDDYKSGGPIGINLKDVDRAVENFAQDSGLTYETVKLKDGKGMAIFRKV